MDFPVNSNVAITSIYLILMPESISVIEGTREALARLGLDYVDIIFAHRPDRTGMYF